jgi:hypothetical protein
MSVKILPGSIVKQATLIQTGAVIDQVSDRGMQAISGQEVSWSGSTFTAPANIDILFQSNAGPTITNTLSLPTQAFSPEDCLVIQLNKSAVTTLTLGTYGSLTAGQYAIVQSSALDPINLASKDQFILFHCHTEGGQNLLLIPLNKAVLLPGSTNYLGIPDGTPSIFKIQLYDVADTTLPTGATPMVDGVAVANGNLVLFSALTSNPGVYLASGIGTSVVWTQQTIFENGSTTPINGDIVEILLGDDYANQIGIWTGTEWSFNDVVRHFSTAGDYWQEESLKTTTLPDNSSGNVFSYTALGSENAVVTYSIERSNGSLNLKETGQLFITHNETTAQVTDAFVGDPDTGIEFSAAISAGNLQLNYTTTSTGYPATMKFAIRRWSDLPGGPAGIPSYDPASAIPLGYLNVAFAMSDGSGIPINCTNPTIVGGATQLVLTFPYTTNVNPGTTGGDLEVVLDGQILPRYVAGSVLDSAYFTEVNTTTIQLDQNYSGTPITIEVLRKQGTLDISNTNASKIQAIADIIVGSSAQVTAGEANYTSIQTAVNASSPGQKILVLANTYTENVVISSSIFIEGKGGTAIMTGNLTFASGANEALVKFLNINGNITFSSGATANILTDCWQPNANTITDSGTGSLYLVAGY